MWKGTLHVLHGLPQLPRSHHNLMHVASCGVRILGIPKTTNLRSFSADFDGCVIASLEEILAERPTFPCRPASVKEVREGRSVYDVGRQLLSRRRGYFSWISWHQSWWRLKTRDVTLSVTCVQWNPSLKAPLKEETRTPFLSPKTQKTVLARN